MSGGEFGGNSEYVPRGTPMVLTQEFSSSGSPISATIPDPPDGQTYVLTGVDAFGATTAAGALVLGLERGGSGIMAKTTQLVSPAFEDGALWRGAITILPGGDLVVVCSLVGVPVECGIIAWGLLLDYVAPA